MIKKKYIVLSLVCFGCLSFAESHITSWLSGGYGFVYEKSHLDDVERQIISSAYRLSDYFFGDNNHFGLYSHLSILIPQHIIEETEQNISHWDRTSYEKLFKFNLIIGPAFKVNVYKNVHFKTSLGLSYTNFSKENHCLDYSENSLGVNFNLGFVLYDTRRTFVDTGINFTHNFLNYADGIRSTKFFNQFEIYLGYGFTF